MTEYRLSDEKIALIKTEFIKETGIVRTDIRDYVFAVADAQLLQEVSRPCPVCRNWSLAIGKNIDFIDCPTCKGSGKETKRLIDIVGEWVESDIEL